MAIQIPQANTTNMIAAIIQRVDFITYKLAKFLRPPGPAPARRAASYLPVYRPHVPAGRMAITRAGSRRLTSAPRRNSDGRRRKCFGSTQNALPRLASARPLFAHRHAAGRQSIAQDRSTVGERPAEAAGDPRHALPDRPGGLRVAASHLPASQAAAIPRNQTLCVFYLHYNRLLARAGLLTDRRSKAQPMRRSFASHLDAMEGNATAALGLGSRAVTHKSYLTPKIAGGQNPLDLFPRRP